MASVGKDVRTPDVYMCTSITELVRNCSKESLVRIVIYRNNCAIFKSSAETFAVCFNGLIHDEATPAVVCFDFLMVILPIRLVTE